MFPLKSVIQWWLFIICFRVKRTKRTGEATRSWTHLHTRTVSLPPNSAPTPPPPPKCEVLSEMAFGRAGDGRDLLQSRREMSAASIASSNLARLFMSHSRRQPLFTRHPPSPLRCTCLLGLCWQVGAHLRHPLSACNKRVRVLRGNIIFSRCRSWTS